MSIYWRVVYALRVVVCDSRQIKITEYSIKNPASFEFAGFLFCYKVFYGSISTEPATALNSGMYFFMSAVILAPGASPLTAP